MACRNCTAVAQEKEFSSLVQQMNLIKKKENALPGKELHSRCFSLQKLKRALADRTGTFVFGAQEKKTEEIPNKVERHINLVQIRYEIKVFNAFEIVLICGGNYARFIVA